MTLAQFHCPPPLPPPFLIPGLPPFCLYINSTTSSSSFFFYFRLRATSRPGIAQLLKGSGPGRVSQGISLICSAQPCLKHPVLWEGGEGLEGGVLGGNVAVSLQGGGRAVCGSVCVCVCVCEELRRIRWRAVAQGQRRHDVCPASSSLSWKVTLLSLRNYEAELGWKPGSQGTLLFSQQDPREPSIAQVTMSIKRQTWPAALLRHLPPSPTSLLGIKAEEGSLQATSPWGTFVWMFRDLLSLNNTLWSQTIQRATPTPLNGTALLQ